MELSVIIQTSTFWPTSGSQTTCAFPELLAKTAKSFEQFYLSRHTGRRLTWQKWLGNADVRATFKSGKTHELNVSTLAMVILLLFEDLDDSDFLTYEVSRIFTTLYPAFFTACEGYQIRNVHIRRGVATAAPITCLCEVQDFEEAPPGT